jgi:hypothetical protein
MAEDVSEGYGGGKDAIFTIMWRQELGVTDKNLSSVVSVYIPE